MTGADDPTGTPEYRELEQAFEARGQQLVAQRRGFVDQLADLVRENEETKGMLAHLEATNAQLTGELEAQRLHATVLESTVADYDTALSAAHAQLDAEHATLSFRIANRFRSLTGRALPS